MLFFLPKLYCQFWQWWTDPVSTKAEDFFTTRMGGCRFVPSRLLETIRHKWYQTGSKYWWFTRVWRLGFFGPIFYNPGMGSKIAVGLNDGYKNVGKWYSVLEHGHCNLDKMPIINISIPGSSKTRGDGDGSQVSRDHVYHSSLWVPCRWPWPMSRGMTGRPIF